MAQPRRILRRLAAVLFPAESPVRLVTTALLVALLLHILAGLLSQGDTHPDEFFQNIQFARYKLGDVSASELPWEFHRQIRPWLEPALSYVVLRGTRWLGIESPFSQAAVIRLVLSLLGWLSVVLLARASSRWLMSPRARTYLAVGLASAWFLPFIHARMLSGNLSGTLFFIGFSLIVFATDSGPRDLLPAAAEQTGETIQRARHRAVWLLVTGGLLLGLAFHVRYQVGLMIAGLMAWLLFERRFAHLSGVALGLSVGLAVGVLVDRWGYGSWTIPAIEYFRVNVLEGAAATWGVHPPWWYVVELVRATPLGLGLILVALVPLAWLSRPFGLLSAVTLPFFLVHCLVGHKEMRFLYPLADAAVPLAVLGGQALVRYAGQLEVGWRMRRAVERALAGVVLVSFVVAVGGAIQPVNAQARLLHAIYDRHPAAAALDLVDVDDPYVKGRLEYAFYAPHRLVRHRIASEDALGASRRDHALILVPRNFTCARQSTDCLSGCQRVLEWPPAIVPKTLLRFVASKRSRWLLIDCAKVTQ